MGKVDALTLSDRLDTETRHLFEHLTRVRNRFAHDFGKVVSAAEGREAWDRLPQAAKDRAPASLTRTSPSGRIVRWCIVVLRARIQNRAIHLNKSDFPYS